MGHRDAAATIRLGLPLRWPFGDGERGWAPAVDLIDSKDEIALRADLPGLDETDIATPGLE